jgi:TatD DNase family protein
MNTLVDSHVHLQDEIFFDDLDEVIIRAEREGIGGFICNGTQESDWQSVLNLSNTFSHVVPCFGLHPWFIASRTSDWISRLESILKDTPGGVGEIGLDHWIKNRNDSEQEEVFRKQIELAIRLKRPAMIHCVRAWERLLSILNEYSPMPISILIHAYSGSTELIQPLVNLGAYFSVSGSVFYEKNVSRRETVKHIPEDRILIETDSPDMTPPESHRLYAHRNADGTFRNEPVNLRKILEGTAELRGVSIPDFQKTIFENNRRFCGELFRSMAD